MSPEPRYVDKRCSELSGLKSILHGIQDVKLANKKTSGGHRLLQFFEAVKGMEMLDGYNVLSADNANIVAVAEINDADRVAAGEWTSFTVCILL